MHKHNFGQTLKLQSAVITLNIRSRSSFGGENSTGSEDRAQKRLILQFFNDGGLKNEVTLKIRSRSAKPYQLFILPQ